MDDDFQARYVAAEQAYGAGDFEAAKAITSTLLAELDPLPDGVEERNAVLVTFIFMAWSSPIRPGSITTLCSPAILPTHFRSLLNRDWNAWLNEEQQLLRRPRDHSSAIPFCH